MIIRETDSVVFHGEQYQVWRNKKGQLHRLHGPAVIRSNGTQYWIQKGQFHRLGGPAIIESDGYEAWYFHDKHHREGGPAVIFPDGVQHWYLDGNKVTREEAEK